ncbi:MAG: glycosyltransferase family 2 protein [Solirubrobacteraceae bacterium]
MTRDDDLSVVVVNYEKPDMTIACLRAVQRAIAQSGLRAETLVVDNGSQDRSVALLERHAPWARVVAIPSNGALPAALNRGWRASSGTWVLMLNNDVFVNADAIVEAFSVATSAGNIGTVALEMRFASQPDVINSSGIAVDYLGVPFDLRIGEPGVEREPMEVFGACGAAALYRREMLAELGGFDESFGFGFEDVDLSWRARMKGWRAFVVPRAIALHAHGATVSTASPFRSYQAGLNRVRLLAKHAPKTMLVRYGPRMVLYDVAYVGYVISGQRTLAPLAGRLRGLREWREYRQAGLAERRDIELAPIQGFRAALRRRSAWTAFAD